MNTSDYKSFHYLENGEIHFSVFSTQKSTNILSPGSYKVTYEEYPKNKIEVKLDTDSENVKYPSYFVNKEEIDKYIDSFFNEEIEKKIRSLGFYHKGGILFHGKEGTGKTSILKYYYNKAIEKNEALVFHIDNVNYLEKCWEFVFSIRQIQNNPIIIMFDEIDKYMETRSGILKSIIDGNLSIHNCMFFGITNHLDKIPEAIKTRPSRFKYCIEIEGIQSPEIIKSILKSIIGDLLKEEELIALSESLKGETLDIIKHRCLDKVMQIEQNKSSIKRKLGF